MRARPSILAGSETTSLAEHSNLTLNESIRKIGGRWYRVWT
jgi:hypothetical protein